MTQEVLRAEIPLGPNGIWGSRNYSTMPLTGLIAATNVDYYGGVISKEGGAARWSVASGILATTVAILAGADWWPTPTGAEGIIFTATGTIRRDAGNGAYGATLASGLTHNQTSPMFVEGGKEAAANARKLFMFTGENAVRVISGVGATTAPAIATTAPGDWSGTNQPRFGFIFNSRLWAGGNKNDGHRIYYSLNTNHEDFTTSGAGSISIKAGVGEYLLAGTEFKGFIVLWKYPKGVFVVDARNADITQWSVQTQSANVGLAGVNAWCAIDDDVLFMDVSGQLQLLSRVDQDTHALRSLSDQQAMRDFIATNVDVTRLWDARMVYYAFKREVHIALTAPGGAGVNNRRLIIDLNALSAADSAYQIKLQPRFRFNDRDICEALWMQKDSTFTERPYIGAENGVVWQLDTDSYTKEGGYSGSFQTAYMDMSHLDPKFASIEKNGRFLEITYEQVGAWYLYADIYWDELFSETVLFRMGEATSGFTYTFTFAFAQRGRMATSRARIIGSGRRISVVFRNAGINETFRLSRCWLGFQAGSERNE